MPLTQRVVQACLFLSAIALVGDVLQMVLSQPEITPRLDSVRRFLARVS
ncbi:hypothetical protein K2X33_11735 [bacterium]|jgi:hypothetical protein|nr:hypothetical protein [bacterium]